MRADLYTYGEGENSVLVVNRAIMTGLRDAGLLRHDRSPPLNPGVDWDAVSRMPESVTPGADIAVCQAAVSLEVLKRIREVSPSTRIVLQRDSTHCRWWKALVEQEQEKFGIRWPVYGGGLLDREMAEYEMADRITVLSRWVAWTFEQEGLGDKVIYVGPQCFDRPKWPRAPWASGRLRVLFAGQTGLRKGLFHLLEAWRRIGLWDSELIVAGVPEPSCPALAAEVERRIAGTPGCRGLGYVDLRRMPALYASCHVLCIPSVEEGSTMTGLEAMSVGRPVIATPSAGIDVLEHGRNGLLVDSGSWEPLAAALLWAHANPEALRAMGEVAAGSVGGCDVPEFGARYVQRVVESLSR